MATRFSFMPEGAVFPSSGFANLRKESISNRLFVSYQDAGSNVALWSAVSPDNLVLNSGNVDLHLNYFMASATSGNVVLVANVEAPVTGTEAANANLFAAGGTLVLPITGSASTIRRAVIPVPADGLTGNTYFRVRVERLGANASDTSSGDFNILSVELRDAV